MISNASGLSLNVELFLNVFVVTTACCYNKCVLLNNIDIFNYSLPRHTGMSWQGTVEENIKIIY